MLLLLLLLCGVVFDRLGGRRASARCHSLRHLLRFNRLLLLLNASIRLDDLTIVMLSLISRSLLLLLHHTRCRLSGVNFIS